MNIFETKRGEVVPLCSGCMQTLAEQNPCGIYADGLPGVDAPEPGLPCAECGAPVDRAGSYVIVRLHDDNPLRG